MLTIGARGSQCYSATTGAMTKKALLENPVGRPQSLIGSLQGRNCVSHHSTRHLNLERRICDSVWADSNCELASCCFPFPPATGWRKEPPSFPPCRMDDDWMHTSCSVHPASLFLVTWTAALPTWPVLIPYQALPEWAEGLNM